MCLMWPMPGINVTYLAWNVEMASRVQISVQSVVSTFAMSLGKAQLEYKHGFFAMSKKD